MTSSMLEQELERVAPMRPSTLPNCKKEVNKGAVQSYEDKIQDFVASFLDDEDREEEQSASSPADKPGPVDTDVDLVDPEATEVADKKAKHACYMRMSRSFDSHLQEKFDLGGQQSELSVCACMCAARYI